MDRIVALLFPLIMAYEMFSESHPFLFLNFMDSSLDFASLKSGGASGFRMGMAQCFVVLITRPMRRRMCQLLDVIFRIEPQGTPLQIDKSSLLDIGRLFRP